MVDHRNSPGVPAEMIQAAAKAGKQVAGGEADQVTEIATMTCSHCSAIVIPNPLRTREREWCSKCDHYICDGCAAIMAASGECLPMKKRFDLLYDRLTAT